MKNVVFDLYHISSVRFEFSLRSKVARFSTLSFSVQVGLRPWYPYRSVLGVRNGDELVNLVIMAKRRTGLKPF